MTNQWDGANVGLDPGHAVREVEGSAVSEDELAQMLRTLERGFEGDWPPIELPGAAADYLRWQLEGPGPEPTVVVVNEHEGRVVGLQIHLARRFRVRGTERRSRSGVLAVVDPDYQGLGLYRARSQFQREHVTLRRSEMALLCPTANQMLLNYGPGKGWRPLGNKVRALVRPRAIWRYGGFSWSSRLAIAARSGLAAAGRVGRTSPAGVGPWTVASIDRFGPHIDEFFEEAASPFDLIEVRDGRYLNWRYCDPRGGRAQVLQAEQGGRVLGYVVFKAKADEGQLLDLLALPGRTDVARSLLRAALRELDTAGVAVVTCWLPTHHPYRRLLREEGFVSLRGDIDFRSRADMIEPEALTFLDDSAARIHVMQGDVDVF